MQSTRAGLANVLGNEYTAQFTTAIEKDIDVRRNPVAMAAVEKASAQCQAARRSKRRTLSSAADSHASARAALEDGRSALVWQRLIADTETPVSAALKLIQSGRGDFILEVGRGRRHARPV